MVLPFTSNPDELRGRRRRLYHEWQEVATRLAHQPEITWSIAETDALGLPTAYRVDYHIRSLCGVADVEHLGQPDVINLPQYAELFTLKITLPPTYPSVDGAPDYCFVGETRPWHPNIRYFGSTAGHVCLNATDTYESLAWGILRIAQYLRYERYHAIQEPPFPEDFRVARWVITQGEANGWI